MNLVNVGSTEHMIDTELSCSIIVDAGASYGEFIEGIKQIMPNVRIYSLECCKTNYRILEEKKFSNVILCDHALVGQSVEGDIEFTEFVGQNGKFHQWGNVRGLNVDAAKKRKEFIETRKYRVPTLKMNDIFDFFGLSKIDYLKLDIEGEEEEVIDTMTSETAGKINQISLEVHSQKNKLIITEHLYELGFGYVLKMDNEIYAKKL